METWKQLSDEEIKMGFVASCIEGIAAKAGSSYREMLERMEAVGLIDRYIYPCYDALHTESSENVITDILETLLEWEQKKKLS